jgi:DNA-binding NarL/FixJ family response regulator
MIKLILADDHQLFLDGLAAILKLQSNYSIEGYAHNGQEVLDLLKIQEVDVILLDVNMPVMDGLETTKQVKLNYPEVNVIILTMFNTKDYIEKLLKSGADGYLLKNTDKHELYKAIDMVNEGQSFFSTEVSQIIMDGLQNKKRTESNIHEVELTDREKEVLICITQEMTTQEIANELCLSSHTIETYRKNLISKLQVKNVAGLVKYAINSGLVN